MPYKPKERSKIDAKWLRLQMSKMGISQNATAAALGIDVASWSRTLNGTREMKNPEIQKFALTFDVPYEEVLRRVGYPVKMVAPGDVEASLQPVSPPVQLIGFVSAQDGAVDLTSKPIDGVARLQVVGEGFLDGWSIICAVGDISATPEEDAALGIVSLADGRLLLRKVSKTFQEGLFNLEPLFGMGVPENSVKILGVIPVVGMGK